MTQPKENTVFYQRYGTHLGIGLAVTVVVGILLLQMSFTGLRVDDATSDVRADDLPPLPETEVQMVENKVIEQQEVDFDATLDLSAQTGRLAKVETD